MELTFDWIIMSPIMYAAQIKAFVKIHWHLRNTARGIVNQENEPMNRAVHSSSPSPLSNGILRSGDIAQPMELITSKTRTVLNLCPVELLCVMTVLFCVLRQLGPGLGAGTGFARVLAPSWPRHRTRHQAGPGHKLASGELLWAVTNCVQLSPVI